MAAVTLTKEELVNLSGWNQADIECLAYSRPIEGPCLEGKVPNTAFFWLLITTVEESPDLTFSTCLPSVIERLGFNVPKNLSSFIRSVRRIISNDIHGETCCVPRCLTQDPGRIDIPLSEKAGVTLQWLLETNERLPQPCSVTNGMLLELGNVREKKHKTYSDLASWVQRILDCPNKPSGNSIERRLKSISLERFNLRRSKKHIVDFLSTEYKPPVAINDRSVVGHVGCSQDKCVRKVAETETSSCSSGHFPSLGMLAAFAVTKLIEGDLPRKLVLLQNVEEQLMQLHLQLNDAERDKKKVDDEVKQSESKLGELRAKVGRYDVHNVYRRDKRAEENRKDLVATKVQVASLTSEFAELKLKLQSALKAKSKYYQQAMSKSCSCHAKIKQLNESVRYLQIENMVLQEENFNLLKGQNDEREIIPNRGRIATKQGNTFSNDIRLVSMKLISLGVAIGKVSQVVRTVVSGLTDMDIGVLPSKAATSGFQAESGILSQIQVAQNLLTTDNATLQLDGTKKRFHEYGGYQVTTEENGTKRTFSMGLEEMVKGDTQCFLDSLKDVFHDMAEAVSVDNSSDVMSIEANLIQSVKNLLTDRHIVNKTFKNQFEAARKELFMKHLTGYDELSTEKKESLVKLHGMFCGLHVLANMGTSACKALKIFEDIALPEGQRVTDLAFKKGTARTSELIFEISKTLTKSGNMRTGCALSWEEYLASVNESNHIVSFLRHRFNVLFVDGAASFYHRNHIMDFIGNYVSCGDTRKLLQCIVQSVDNEIVQAALRSLGIIAHLVTLPLWRVIERKDVHIFDLNIHWLHLRLSLKEFSEDASPLLDEVCLFNDFPPQKDRVYEELFKQTSPSLQTLTKECLEVLCFHLEKLVARQLEDQLPGGKYSLPSNQLMAESKSVPTTNRSGEKDFSDLDREVSRAPQKTTAHLSSGICFRNNRTYEYMAALSEEDRKRLIRRAVKLAPVRRRKNKEKLQRIRKLHQQEMERNKMMKIAKKEKKAKQKQALVDKVEELGGLWMNEEEVREKVVEIPKSQKRMDALKTQINYHAIVLCSVIERDLKQFSKSKVKHGEDKLLSNLVAILETNQHLGDSEIHVVKQRVRSLGERQILIQQMKQNTKNDTYRQPVPKVKGTTAVPKAKGTTAQQRASKLLSTAKKQMKRKHVSLSDLKERPSKLQKIPDVIEDNKFSFTYVDSDVNRLIAIAFEENWYLGKVVKVQSPTEAKVEYMKAVGARFFKWNTSGGGGQPEFEDTDAKFILSKGVTISPKGSSLRVFEIDGDMKQVIDVLFEEFSERYFKT